MKIQLIILIYYMAIVTEMVKIKQESRTKRKDLLSYIKIQFNKKKKKRTKKEPTRKK